MIYALHGFLGLPGDWSVLKVHNLEAPSLYDSLQPFDVWASSFNQQVRESAGSSNILIGYSMGGRLALHALRNAPDLWKKVIVLSAHPGLLAEEEKKQRRWADEKWQKDFEQMEWTSLLSKWNSQAVFQGSRQEIREEKNYSRNQLVASLKEWSLANQNDLRSVVQEQQEKIVWVAGEKDQKFVEIGRELKRECPSLEFHVLPNCGHRLLLEGPPAIEFIRDKVLL